MPHVPPDFLSSLVALANFMRLSLQKAAHANLADAACRKSGSHQRTWAENGFFKRFHSMCHEVLPFSSSLFARMAERWKGLPPDFLSSFMALANFMRLSLMKAAHPVVGGAP